VLDTARVSRGPKGAQGIERLVLPFSTDGEAVDRAVLLMAVEPGESLSEADAEAGRGRRAAGGA
jgi:hypothetical protein